RVKLIYRPLSIKNERKDAENKLILEQRGNETWLKNPTPYYMALTGVKVDGKDVSLSNKTLADIACFSPFSEVSLGKKISGNVSVNAINDWGGVQNYEIH
ncbi:fimbrial chaperone protein, partial [Escherichia coli]